MNLRKFSKIFLALILSLLALFCLTIAFVQTEWGQNWLARRVTTRLSRDLQSRISIDHVSFSFFNKMNLRGVLVEDRKKDTLIYAGVAQVRITDWFFFKDEAELEYIGLKDAVIKFNRTDSVWNYKFLEDYFGGSGGGKKKSGIEFNLKKVLFENVVFESKDAWLGNDMIVKVEGLDLDANDISITRNIVRAKKLDLIAPYFHQYVYTGNKPPSQKKIVTYKKTYPDTSLQWNPLNWNVLIDDISIKNGTYRNDRGTLTTRWKHFDDRHINFSNINGSIAALRLVADTLTAVTKLSTRERSGFHVQQLNTNLRLHPQIMEFSKLTLKTNRSYLSDYFAMRFKDIDDLQDFIHAVRMEGLFKNARVSSDDIAFFAPEVSDWNRIFEINGRVRGTVDALDGKSVVIRSGNSGLSGDFSIQGLPDVNRAFIHVDARELFTNYNDAGTFIPAIRKVETPNLRKLGAIRFHGTYTGFINDFVAYGTLHTALGSLRTDLNMKLPANATPVYSGTVSTNSFQLGQFFNNPQLGVVDFHGHLKGKGFNWSSLDITLDGDIHRFHYGGYTYRNIVAKGRLNNQSFDGDFKIDDPNAQLTLNGLITFGNDQPTFDVRADIVKANLKALQLAKEDLSLSGEFNLNFRGKSLKDFMGTARMSNATLMQEGRRLSFDSLTVSSFYANGVRVLHARSNEFDAKVTGQFDLETLPDAFTLFLNRYYPAYIKPPRTRLPNQSFVFDITTGMVEDYVKIIDKRLSGFNNSTIKGSLNVAANNMILDADVPQFGFKDYQFTNVVLHGEGDFRKLSVNGTVSEATIRDSIVFPNSEFTLVASNDVSDITLKTTSNQAVNEASLSARVRTFSNGVSVHFNPSSFVVNGKTWTIEEGGELDFRKNSVVQGQMILKEAQQEIRLSTQPSDIGNWNDLHVIVRNLNIGDISAILLPKNRIEGILNGEIIVEDPQNRFNVIGTVRTEQLRVDNDSVGQVQGTITYNKNTGLLKAYGGNIDPLHQLKVDLAIDIDDPNNEFEDRISVRPINYPVAYLENFIGVLFSDLKGFMTGELNIVGEGANRKYVGKGRLIDAGLKVNFTQVTYTIDDTEIFLRENEIDFGTMKIRDKEGNTATVRGTIGHTNFRNMYYDIEANVDGRPMQLLNTNYNHNEDFYGRAWGTGSLILTGPENAMNMYIEANPSETDSSYITIPPSKSRETGAASFMVERKYGVEMDKQVMTGATSNITYVINLTANPMVNMEVILDELTGDIIKGRGKGNLIIKAGTSEPMSVRGRLNIEEGSYLFTFQSFFKKPFVLRKGESNYIEWNGDPYDANIKFDAVYRAENVSFAPLVQTLNLSNSEAVSRTRADVNVIALLTGNLFKPNFSFRLEFPEDNPVYTDPSFVYGLKQIESNTNEINKQVTFLIVFNSFAPYETTQSTYNPLNEFAYSTISGILFSEVNRKLNQWLSKILRNNNVTFNFTGSLYNRNLVETNTSGFRINQSNLSVSVSAPLIKERVQITFGGTFDVPIQSDIQQSTQLFPDVSVDVLINKSGSIRAIFFYTQTPDWGLVGASNIKNNRAGAKLSYRKEFNSITEFFGGKKKKKQPRNYNPEPAIIGQKQSNQPGTK